MDSAAVRGLLAASLDPDADNRRRAELQLKQVEETAGFLDCLLDILEAEQENSIRLSSTSIPLHPARHQTLCSPPATALLTSDPLQPSFT
jgi:hypothetical protein